MKASHSLTRIACRRRGVVVFTALVILGIMSVTILAMLQYAAYQQRMTNRRVEREAVYYAAEAGIDQVVHYFNFPSEYVSNTSLFTRDPDTDSYYTPSGSIVFSQPSRGVTGGGTSLQFTPPTLVFGYEPEDGVNRAHVSELTISLPEAADFDFSDDAVLVVQSQAQNAAGQTRIVRATLVAEQPLYLPIPAPLISLVGHNANGQLNVHWGEAWFREDFNLPASGGLANIPGRSEDPWFHLRTEGLVLLSNGRPAPEGSHLTEEAHENYFQPWLGTDEDPEHTNIWQHADDEDTENIDWPDPLDYDFWKSIAQTRGLYFSWNDDGTRLVEGTSGDEIRPNEFLDLIDGSDEFQPGVDGESQSLPPATIVFVDTLDGNPPNGIPAGEAGSNLCDLTLTGGGETLLRGVIYVGGDVRLNISGTQGVWLQDPDRVDDPSAGGELQATVFMNGLFYCEGVMTSQGSQTVYGALFAKGGFGGNGGHDIYYDARLRLGLPFSLNPDIRVARVVELVPELPDS